MHLGLDEAFGKAFGKCRACFIQFDLNINGQKSIKKRREEPMDAGDALVDDMRKRARKDAGGSVRYSRLLEAFDMAAHPVLTACSEKDFLTQFSFVRPDLQGQIYELYTQVVAAVHKGAKAELEAICTDMKLKDVLAGLDKPVDDVPTSTTWIAQEDKPPRFLVSKDAVDAKQSEADELRRILQEEEEQKCSVTARINRMHKEIEAMEDKEAASVGKLKQAMQLGASLSL